MTPRGPGLPRGERSRRRSYSPAFSTSLSCWASASALASISKRCSGSPNPRYCTPAPGSHARSSMERGGTLRQQTRRGEHVKDRLRSWATAVPGVHALSTYERAWLSKDIIAGLVLTALLVPQGMAYAELAGLPPVTGLYTSILCLIGYAIFGPSRILVLGPVSSLGPMIAATIAPLALAGGDPEKAVA